MSLSPKLLRPFRFRIFVASFCFTGFSPVFPGTVASALALGIHYSLALSLINQVFLCCGVIFLGLWSIGEAERMYSRDSKHITIDECLGQWVALINSPLSIGYYIAAFALFRFFDIRKPWIINHSQRLQGSYGVLADDILAGGISFLILQSFLLLSR